MIYVSGKNSPALVTYFLGKHSVVFRLLRAAECILTHAV